MLKREQNLLWHYDGPAPPETRQLETEGHCLLRAVFDRAAVAALRDEVLAVFATVPCDDRAGLGRDNDPEQYRYQMFNRSPLCQRAMAHPRILAVVDPLLGIDCHAINSTAWRNPPGAAADPRAYFWHVDHGPQIPRPDGVDWPASIPYPLFVIATHIYLMDCGDDDGPTTVVPTSHTSGLVPPQDRRFEAELRYRDHGPVRHIVRAGDVGCFASDVWHRRALPTPAGRGRLFLQTNYGRRDIAQRVLPTSAVNHASAAARARATTHRDRLLLGLHAGNFYDG